MPAFASNFSDEQIADIIDYLYNSFVTGHKGSVKAERIKAIRNKDGYINGKRFVRNAWLKRLIY